MVVVVGGGTLRSGAVIVVVGGTLWGGAVVVVVEPRRPEPGDVVEVVVRDGDDPLSRPGSEDAVVVPSDPGLWSFG
jgi:hypothetical protein